MKNVLERNLRTDRAWECIFGISGDKIFFELNKIWGELKFFKIKGGRKRGGRGEFLKFSLGGKLLEMKLQTENKFQNKICTPLVGFLTSVF